MAVMNNAIPPSEDQLRETLRAALLADAAVYDCAVLTKKDGGSRRFIAFIVPKGPIATERLSFRLRTLLGPEINALQDYVLVSSLPVMPDGKVDEGSLYSLVVPDDEQFQLWEKELKETSAVHDVAIVSRNVNGRWSPPTPAERQSYASASTVSLHRVVWRRANQRSYIPIWGDVLVFADGEGVALCLCGSLKNYGIRTIMVEAGKKFIRVGENHYQINPTESSDYKLLLRSLATDGKHVSNICHLWSYTRQQGDCTRLDEIDSTHELGFYSLVHLTQALAQEHTSGDIRICVAANYAQRVHAGEPVNPAKATTIGLLKSLVLELPWIDGHHVDLEADKPDANAALLLAEMTASRGRVEICYRGGHRFEPGLSRLEEVHDPTASCQINRGGLYLIVGGLGGVGAQLARALITEFDAKLILTGRTRLPDSASWPKLLNKDTTLSRRIKSYLDIESAGGEFVYRAVDVCHTKRMRDVISGAENRWSQPLSGVFHLAGSLGSSMDLSTYWRTAEQHGVAVESVEKMAEIHKPKVQGTVALFEVLEDRPDALFVGFSSVASYFGASTMAAYTSANSFLESYVLAQADSRRPTYTFSWTTWDGIGMSSGSAGYAEFLREMGYRLLSTNEGIRLLLAGLSQREPHLIAGLEEEIPRVSRDVVNRCHSLDRIVVYFTAPQGSVATTSIRSKIRERLRHEHFEVVHFFHMPLGADGSVDRLLLAKQPAGQPPPLEWKDAPRTSLEKLLVEIWGEVLGLERVGVHDNFFDLGGHSLLATQVVSRIREGLRVELPLRKLFEQATVAELAAEIERGRAEEEEAGTGQKVARIGKRKREEGKKLELSYAQQRLWFLNQLQPENAYYNCPLAIGLGAGVDVGAVEKSLREIVRRHEVLRTRIVSVEGKPEQVIEEEVKLQLVVEEVDGREEAERVCRGEAERPFDLSAGPLRVRLLRVAGEAGYVLMVTMHHIVSDGWSLGILLRELGELYEGYASGSGVKLEELGIQYGDFAEWQREWLQGEVLEEQLSYWREQLEGMEMLQLPTDRVRPAEQSYRGGERVVVLSQELSEGIRKLSQREGGTLFMVALAGFQALLGRYTGQKEISVGTAIANRNRDETEGLIGFFVNTLVMRTEVSGEESFGELVRRVKGVAVGAYGHQDLPFEKLVEELQPERSMSRNPLVQVMLTVQNAPWKGMQLPAGMTILGGEVPTTRFDLEVHVWEMGEQVVVRCIYSRGLFDEETVARMMRHYERLLDGGVKNPEEKVWRLPLMSEGERLEVLARSRGEEKEYADKDVCTHELIERQARKAPERVAVVCEGEGISYGELNRRANQLGRYLRKKGVGPEVLVGIAMERSVEMVVGILGILKAGGAYVPLDVEYPKERLRYMVEDAGVGVLVSERGVLSRLPESVVGGGVEVVRLDEEEERERIGAESGEDFASGVRGENLAYMIYTSGSTGKPKGAMNEHRGLTNRLLWMQERFGLGAEDVVLQKTPISFDVSVWELLWAVMVGARLVMAKPGGHRDSGYLAEVIAREQVTTLHFVPSMLQAFLQEEGLEEKCRSVKRVMSSGEALGWELQERFYERMGRAGDDGVKLYNLYGPTEAGIDVTWWECERGVGGGVVPIGRAIANVQMYVLDEKQEVVAEGVSGELYIGGVQVGRG